MPRPPENRQAPWMSAAEAAERLGVTRSTLYAYVSRGLLNSAPAPSPIAGRRGGRASRYRRSDVERLARRHAAVRQPRHVAVQTLDWGLPVLTSALTCIDGDRLFYRGTCALTLARTATLEQVAQRLWSVEDAAGGAHPPSPPNTPRQPDPPGESGRPGEPGKPPHPLKPRTTAALRQALKRLGDLPAPSRTLHAFELLYAHEAAHAARRRPDRTPGLGTPRVGSTQPVTDAPISPDRLLQMMVDAVTLGRAGPPTDAPIHQRLALAWGLDAPAADALRHALVLCADHELNPSSFTARCVAATGASLGASVGAGLAALSGPRHGAMTERVEALWQAHLAPDAHTRLWRRQLQARVTRRTAERAARGLPRVTGDLIDGFGHPLYAGGDPRARAILARLPRDRRRDRFVALVAELTGEAPALDFALVALRHALGAPRGAAFAVFALARTAGWIAHALEQHQRGQLIRPRAAYDGPTIPPVPDAVDAQSTQAGIDQDAQGRRNAEASHAHLASWPGRLSADDLRPSRPR